MVLVVQNADLKQNRHSDQAVLIAVTSQAVFELGEGETQSTRHYEKAVAFSFIQAIKKVNDRLLEKNPSETLLFDIILLSNEPEDCHSQIVDSAKHYGLEIGRFLFCSKEESIDSLLSNKVKLFLSTDTTEVSNALQKGIASALLHQQMTDRSPEQLKVLFSGDYISSSEDTSDSENLQALSEPQLQDFKAAKESIKEFASLIGGMRERFLEDDSPLCTGLLTARGSRNTCAQALKTLRTWGVRVDQAHCLAGAPRGPILSEFKPHVVFTDGPSIQQLQPGSHLEVM